MRTEQVAIVARELKGARVQLRLRGPLLPDHKERGAGTIFPSRHCVGVELLEVEAVGVLPAAVRLEARRDVGRARQGDLAPARDEPVLTNGCAYSCNESRGLAVQFTRP